MRSTLNKKHQNVARCNVQPDQEFCVCSRGFSLLTKWHVSNTTWMPPKCSDQKYLLTVICNLYHVVRSGSSLSVWLYLIMQRRKQTVLLFPRVFTTKNVWCRIAWLYNLGLPDYRIQAQFMTSHYLLINGDLWSHAPIYMAERHWIRKELAFRLGTSSTFQAGRTSEEPTAPNTIGYSINVRGLIQPAHKTNNLEKTGPPKQNQTKNQEFSLL